MSRFKRKRLHLGRAEDFAKTSLWRINGGTFHVSRGSRSSDMEESIKERALSFLRNILSRHW